MIINSVFHFSIISRYEQTRLFCGGKTHKLSAPGSCEGEWCFMRCFWVHSRSFLFFNKETLKVNKDEAPCSVVVDLTHSGWAACWCSVFLHTADLKHMCNCDQISGVHWGFYLIFFVREQLRPYELLLLEVSGRSSGLNRWRDQDRCREFSSRTECQGSFSRVYHTVVQLHKTQSESHTHPVRHIYRFYITCFLVPLFLFLLFFFLTGLTGEHIWLDLKFF